MCSFKFKDIEEDLGIAIRDMQISFGLEKWNSLDQKKGLEIWQEFYLKALFEVISAYGQRRIFEPLINYSIEQWEAQGGIEYFKAISVHLIQFRDTENLVKLWRSVMAKRKGPEYEIAMRELTEGLALIGSDAPPINSQHGEWCVVITDLIDETIFWQLIAEAKRLSTTYHERPKMLRKVLSNVTSEQIKQFRKLLFSKIDCAYTSDLWAVAYIACGGCGDNQFEAFRCWLVSEGEVGFTNALVDPESVVELIPPSSCPGLEGMISAVNDLYSAKTGEKLRARRTPNLALKGSAWSDNELPTRFPRAWGKFC
jgi:hypothetical protein